eukprot:9580986-Heterocapsa_arctica.AAC.1
MDSGMRRASPPCFTESTLRRRLKTGTRSRKPRANGKPKGLPGPNALPRKGRFPRRSREWTVGPRTSTTSNK